MLIGVDLGGTGVQAGLVDGGKIVRRSDLPTEAEQGKDRVIQNILKVIEDVFDERAKGIGIGCPGTLKEDGTVIHSPNLPINGVNLKKVIGERFGKPVRIDNDANCYVLAEALFGSGMGKSTVLGLTLGTGLGGALVIDGEVFRGRGNAGEFGHMTICYNGPESKCCGNHGCIENYVGGGNVSRRTGMTLRYLFDQASEGNKQAIGFWKEFGSYLGVAVSNYVNILDPEIIVIGGTVTEAWKLFFPSLEGEMKKRVMDKREVLIAKAGLKDPGIIGSAHLFKG